MVKMRLKRMGSKYNAFYRIVVADQRSPRDGKYIEEIGYYNPHSKKIKVNIELKDKWVSRGAVLTKTVKNLLTKVKQGGFENNKANFLKLKPKKKQKIKSSEDKTKKSILNENSESKSQDKPKNLILNKAQKSKELIKNNPLNKLEKNLNNDKELKKIEHEELLNSKEKNNESN